MKLYATSKNNDEFQTIVIKSVNLMLGREIINVEQAKSGTVVAVHIDDWIQATTLLSEPLKTSGLKFDSSGLEPLVRVTGMLSTIKIY
jgi:hypothetical protein